MTKKPIPLPSTDPAPIFARVDLTELQNEGVLMAANEAFFWPRGLTLSWTWHEDGTASDLHIREWVYADGHIEPITLEEREDGVAIERRIRYTAWAKARKARMTMASAIVTLTPEECAIATARAERVMRENHARGWKHKYDAGNGETELDVKIRGYGAEIAASKWSGLPWNDDYLGDEYLGAKVADIGRRTEVRNGLGDDYSLTAYENDPVERLFVLMVGKLPTFRFAGWIEGRDLKVKERWGLQTRKGVLKGFWARQNELHQSPLPEDA